MAYNKAAEEKKWLQWKMTEETELRRLGVKEDVIKRLREADWEDFKAERRFFEHCPDTGTYLDWQAADEFPKTVRTAQDLLDDIDNEELLRLLLSMDKLTLQIAVWRMEGCTNAEIAKKSGLSIGTVKIRIWRLKQKMKNIL